MNRVLLGIGSNIGDRLQYIYKSIKKISRYFGLNNMSQLLETEPLGPAKRKYLNLVIEVSTLLSPFNILQKVKKIEKKFGRDQIEKWGSRTIDIDILFYNDIILCHSKLNIPHQEIPKRRFVLEPLCQIDPSIQHPVLKKTCRELLHDLLLKQTGKVENGYL